MFVKRDVNSVFTVGLKESGYLSQQYTFELTHASARTFKGCNVVWFMVQETKDKGSNYLYPPALHDVLQT